MTFLSPSALFHGFGSAFILPALVAFVALPPRAIRAQAALPPSTASTADPRFGPWVEPGARAPGSMKFATFPSKLAGSEVSYVIYLPPGYAESGDRRYPVVYWLHGRGGSEAGAANFAGRLDAAIRTGKAPAMIVVGVNGRKTSSWVDAHDGSSPVQSVIVKELIPHIDATYRTLARRESRAIEGFSMGGAGAPKIGFKHPELFGAVGVISGALHDFASYSARGTALQDIYGGSREYFEANDPWHLVAQNADRIRGHTFIRVAVGDADDLLGRNTAYHERLAKLQIEHAFDIIPGARHDPGQVYDGLGYKTWAFYTRAFGASEPPASSAPAATPPSAPVEARAPRGPDGRPGGANEAPPAWAGADKIEHWQAFTVTTEDGVSTPAIWAAPAGPGPFPAIIWFHGAPAAQGERGERNEADRGRFDLFLKAGFVVCLGDYRGEPSAGPAPSGVDDATAIVRHVKSLPCVDPKRVAVMGHSMGGATTLFTVTREPVACIVTSASAAYAVLGLPMGSLRGRPAGGALPAGEFDKAKAFAILDRINSPLLIFYGENDPLSRVNRTIYDLMRELGKDVRLETYPGEHHGMLFRPADRERSLHAWTSMVDFVSGVLNPR